MRMVTTSRVLATAAIAILSLAGTASRAQLLTDSGRGYLNDLPSNNGNTANNNFFAGYNGLNNYRDHFDFAIPTLSGSLTSATLELDQPGGTSSAGHTGGTTTYTLYSLGAFGTYNFSAIGTGTVYGSATLTSSSNGTSVNISLNSAGLTAIAGDQGATFSLGGKDSGEGGPAIVGDFGNTSPGTNAGGDWNSKLLLVTSTGAPAGTPEPGSVALVFSMGAIGAVSTLRRRSLRKNA